MPHPPSRLPRPWPAPVAVVLMVLAGILAQPSAIARPDQACLIEGTLVLGPAQQAIRECIETRSMAEQQFRPLCQQHLDEAIALAASVGGRIERAGIHWYARCPRPAQGACAGYGGGPLTALYYGRGEEDLARLPEGCRQLGGQWADADG